MGTLRENWKKQGRIFPAYSDLLREVRKQLIRVEQRSGVARVGTEFLERSKEAKKQIVFLGQRFREKRKSARNLGMNL